MFGQCASGSAACVTSVVARWGLRVSRPASPDLVSQFLIAIQRHSTHRGGEQAAAAPHDHLAHKYRVHKRCAALLAIAGAPPPFDGAFSPSIWAQPPLRAAKRRWRHRSPTPCAGCRRDGGEGGARMRKARPPRGLAVEDRFRVRGQGGRRAAWRRTWSGRSERDRCTCACARIGPASSLFDPESICCPCLTD